MKLAIMQPYFFPYIGYFQLINSVDEFVIYDNIKFTKKGWINRNRILVNGQDAYITLPLRRDSDYLHVCQRFLADGWSKERRSLLSRIEAAYRKAPYYEAIFPLVKECLFFEEDNLFLFIRNTLNAVNEYIQIKTPLIASSSIAVDHSLIAGEKVIAICKARLASRYINPIGGTKLYEKADFLTHGIDLKFLRSHDLVYKQFDNEFVPWLSILDVMMFNSVETIQSYLSYHEMI